MNEETYLLEQCEKMTAEEGFAFFARLRRSCEYTPEARYNAFRTWAGLGRIDFEKGCVIE